MVSSRQIHKINEPELSCLRTEQGIVRLPAVTLGITCARHEITFDLSTDITDAATTNGVIVDQQVLGGVLVESDG